MSDCLFHHFQLKKAGKGLKFIIKKQINSQVVKFLINFIFQKKSDPYENTYIGAPRQKRLA